VSANTFINLGMLGSQVVGMLILAPVLLKTTNGDPLLLILAGLFLLAAVLITIIPQFHFSFANTNREVSVRAVRREFAEGWMRVSRDPIAFLSLVLLVTTSILTLVIATLLPKFSSEVLDIDPANIVFVLAPVGIAVFLGLRTVEYFSDRFNKLVTISAAYILMAAALIALGLVPASADFVESLDPLTLFSAGPLNEQAARIFVTILYANAFGFSITVVLTMGRVLINERMPRAMQGRVFAAQTVLTNLLAILPVLSAGLIADAVGVAPVLVIAGIAAILAAAWSHARGTRVIPAQDLPSTASGP
jgi:MFS family permease